MGDEYNWVKRQFVKGAEMKKGEIKRKVTDRGFGFIIAGNKEYFFHSSQCKTSFDNLNEGDAVTFDTENSPKGQRAVDVERV